jgi:hypothetical protein
MSFVQDDHMIQAFAADTPDEALHVGILPRTPGGAYDFLDPHVPHPLPKGATIDPVPIAQQKSRGFVPWECFHDLLRCPLRRRVFRDIEMDHAAPLVGHDEQYKEHFVGHRGHDKEIQDD